MDKGGSYTQIAGQEADNEQKADADATAVQWKPSNTAGSIRVLSPGDGGDVTQSNDATAVGIATNDNETKQSIDQTQGSGSMAAKAPESEDAKKARLHGQGLLVHPDRRAEGRSGPEGVRGRDGGADQAVERELLDPGGSRGDDGDVTQSNDATALGIGSTTTRRSSRSTRSRAADGVAKPGTTQGQARRQGTGSEYLQVAARSVERPDGGRRRGRAPGQAVERRTRPFASSSRATTVTSRSPTARPRSRPR